MPTIPGTQVINKIVPTDTADVYPTHEDSYGMGGFQTGFADLTAINAIPAERRKRGMVVYNNDNSNYYRLEANLTTWTNIGTLEGGGGGDPYATQEEAEEGTVEDKAMNPLRTAQALIAQIIPGTNLTKTPVPGGVQLDASATGSMEYVFWPSSPTQTGVLFNDWEDMCAAILALPEGVAPFITFRENFTVPLANMPVGGWDMRGAAWESPLIATGNVTVTIPDGVIIDNLVSIEQGLAVECNPTTADGVFTHSAYGGLQILIVDFGANLYNLGSKALIDQVGQVVIALNGASTIGAGPANVGPWVKANTANTVLAIMVVASGSTGFPDGWIVGGVAGSVLIYQHGITFTNPVITWGGDAPIYLNSSKAENLPYDNGASGLTATQVQSAIDELAGMGGGGGSAYPDSFIVETTAGTRVLTAADQGFITSFVAGVTFQLPDTAADGETYKFTSAAAPIVVDPNGKVVLSFGSANSFTIGVGQHYTLVAINVDIGAGVQLYWLVVRATQLSYPTWDADIYFMPGMLAEKDGILYQCRTAGKNVDPEIGNSAVWIVLKPERELQASEVLSSSDISFAADTAPSNFNNGLVSVVSDGARGKLVVEYMFDTPGVDVTQIVIDLTAALMANPVLASLVPGGGNPGTCITGALDWPCRLTGTSIVMTIPAGISLTGISGTLFKAVIPL